MLLALTNGKAGRIKQDIASGSTWRSVFRASEDLLTASVFGRLAYLDGPMLWTILRRTFGVLPDFKVVDLVNIEFWPVWDDDEIAGRTVEPDIFLQFHVGDPSQRIDVIVEAKLGVGAVQDAEQWRRQWLAYLRLQKSIGEPWRMYHMAIGGMGRNAAWNAGRLISQMPPETSAIEIMAANWPALADSVYRQLNEQPVTRDKRILIDIIEALALAGYRHINPLVHLKSSRKFDPASLVTLTSYDFQEI